MDPVARFWLLTLVLALGTWLMRSLPIMLHGHVPHPAWAERLLRFVPVAAMTALTVPGVLYSKTAGVYSFSPAHLAAGAVALLVAIRSRNIAATLASGMVVLWAAQWAMNAPG